MKIRVRCFATVRELLGTDELEVELAQGATLAQLKEQLAERAPDLLRLPLAQAVNQTGAQTNPAPIAVKASPPAVPGLRVASSIIPLAVSTGFAKKGRLLLAAA